MDFKRSFPVLKNMGLVVVGTLILAFGTALFILPFDLVCGGISSIAIILNNLLGVDFISKINSFALEKYLPDVTVFINLSSEAAFARKKGADENDRLEQAGREFHKRVYEGYCTLAKQNPDRYVVINGAQTPQEIFNDVIKALKEKGCL